MLIFYSGAYKRTDAPATAPIEASEAEAKSVFAKLGGEGSFIGILLGSGRTLQLCHNTDGTLYAEVLKEEGLTIRYCTVNVPLAELLIEAAFRREDFEQKIAFSRVTWHDDAIKNA